MRVLFSIYYIGIRHQQYDQNKFYNYDDFMKQHPEFNDDFTEQAKIIKQLFRFLWRGGDT